MFLPLMPRKATCAHDVGHGGGLGSGWRALDRLAIAGVASVILWPEAVEDKAMVVFGVTLGGAFGVAFPFAPVGRPAEGHDVIVEIACAFAFGVGGKG